MIYEWSRDDDFISTDPQKLDLDVIHTFLSASYWAKGISREIIQKSIEHSLVFGVYHINRQVGFARMITDYATFSYLADVFILEEMRGRGLGSWLIECIVQCPEIQGQRLWALFTRDAHWLYEKNGFIKDDTERAKRLMTHPFSNVYKQAHE